jgi:hypothetical protein
MVIEAEAEEERDGAGVLTIQAPQDSIATFIP